MQRQYICWYYGNGPYGQVVHSTHATLHAARLAAVALQSQAPTLRVHTSAKPQPLPRLYWHTRLLLLVGYYRCPHCGCKYCVSWY